MWRGTMAPLLARMLPSTQLDARSSWETNHKYGLHNKSIVLHAANGGAAEAHRSRSQARYAISAHAVLAAGHGAGALQGLAPQRRMAVEHAGVEAAERALPLSTHHQPVQRMLPVGQRIHDVPRLLPAKPIACIDSLITRMPYASSAADGGCIQALSTLAG